MNRDKQPGTTGDEAAAEAPSVTRRTILGSTAGLATAAVGVGALAGTVAAWNRFDADFMGCSAVWMIVDRQDLDLDPPTVAHVVVETETGDTDCRVVEFTSDQAETVRGRYGDAPVVKYTAELDEKVLAVLMYNYVQDATGEDRFAEPSCLLVNDHRCAQTPDTADLYQADCVQAAKNGHWNGSYWDDGDCLDRIIDVDAPKGGRRGR